ncbi:hypothetical protein Pmani_029781 [Petrolisthes manimaculis]|uniref:Uncharacterized protein n=1 Tax=Petrolisthes manimaculis TaxID=1843537 RepID=A0AAE1TWM0_9EUCA|nr:hypothetical protein Pmani_029781 [Petrolisthes manimaculis]
MVDVLVLVVDVVVMVVVVVVVEEDEDDDDTLPQYWCQSLWALPNNVNTCPCSQSSTPASDVSSRKRNRERKRLKGGESVGETSWELGSEVGAYREQE